MNRVDRIAEKYAESIRGFDPVKVSARLEKLVEQGTSRKYYRFRASRFYGGSAVGDVVLCNLRCAFCWTGRPRDDPRVGYFVEAGKAASRLIGIARARGYRVLRLSAGEPTLGWKHLSRLIELLYHRVTSEVFVLETNGVLLGAYPSRVRVLEDVKAILLVRVSIKACSPYWFKVLTGAKENAFEYQLKAVEEIYSREIPMHVALFLGFGSKKCWAQLVEELVERTGSDIVDMLEPEHLVLYSTTMRRLRHLLRAGISPNPEFTVGRSSREYSGDMWKK